jgi:hypothetical protein
VRPRWAIQRVVNRFGYRFERAIPADLDESTVETIRRVASFTMTSPEEIAALCSATEYVVRSGVQGDFVECGVWKGGSMMAVALTLGRLAATDRTLWLYDTFAGMAAPTEVDRRAWDPVAASTDFATGCLDEGGHKWAFADLDLVRTNMRSTGYPSDHLRFVPGLVEDTIPESAPEQIALLRLDTDFHDSTRHELEHLYPRLGRGGVLIVDDYGSWHGARKAVDDYVADGHPMHLVRVDSTVHLAVKL